jgi:hypothetical protein
MGYRNLTLSPLVRMEDGKGKMDDVEERLKNADNCSLLFHQYTGYKEQDAYRAEDKQQGPDEFEPGFIAHVNQRQ